MQATAQVNIDSLRAVWLDESQSDSLRFQAIDIIAWDGFLFSQPDSTFYYAKLYYDYAETKNLKRDMSSALYLMGISFEVRNLYADALKYYQRELKIDEELNDKKGVAVTLNGIGNIYFHQGNYEQSLDYYERSLEIKRSIGDTMRMASSLSGIGLSHQNLDNHEFAMEYFLEALMINEKLKNNWGISSVLGSIGSQHGLNGDFTKAIDYYYRSLEIQIELNNRAGECNTRNNIGLVHNELGQYNKAIDQCKQGLALSEEIGVILRQKEACGCLYNAYKSSGNGNKALEYHEQMLALDDSLNAEETAKKLQQMEFAKQMLQDSIAQVEADQLVEEAHQEEVREKNRTRNIFGGVGVFALLLAGGFFWRWRYVQQSKVVLQTEKDRSENLLLNILPADIAAELKEKGRADARDFEMVSILFTDFKGFTAASEKLSAQELVAEINTCFEAFDGIMGKYNIEKIKTIGDAYMAAGGLPVPTADSVKNTVLAALEMQSFISDRKAKLDAEGKPGFEMRVGVHTGPVVAGIVGIKKFQYDIWGDTVNTASRMESSGEVGKVNISEATYELLKDDAQFSFESRGKIEAKGKGELEMYFISQKG